MHSFPLRPATICTLACLCTAAPALAYTPQWLECAGEQAITTGGATTKQPATDIYVYDSDTRNLFKYSEAQKRLSYLGAKAVTDQELRWSGTGSGIEPSQWDGQLDRNTMSLRISYKTSGETRLWTETCKPTNQRPES